MELSKEVEAQVLEVIKNNPEAVKKILGVNTGKMGTSKHFNEDMLKTLVDEFGLIVCPETHQIRTSIFGVVKFGIGINHARELNPTNIDTAQAFLEDLLDLIRRYR